MSVLRMPARMPAQRNPQLDFKQRNLYKPHRFPPATAGLNLKDSIADMKPGDALKLDNLIPAPDGISSRNGRDLWTPAPSAFSVKSLFDYAAPNADTLFAALNAKIYNVSAKGAGVLMTLPGAVTSDEWYTAQIQSTAGTFLIAVNGVDAPIVFNGSAWAAHTMTFAAAPAVINTFVHVFAHMGRLWFVAKDSSDLYYLQVASIGGALTKFSIGSLMRRGGYIVCTNALSRDGGLGSDDLFVILTSKGEVLCYAGNNPASINSWGLIGVYMIPPPIGRRCIAKMGADLAVLTTAGIVPMQEVMRLAAVQQAPASLTNRINSMLKHEYERNGDEFGWEVCEYPTKNLVLLNVPLSPTESFPYVMHAETGGWCRFTGYNATCFTTFKGRLFNGDALGNIWEYTNTFTDGDEPILCEMWTAFDMLGSPALKTVSVVRPVYKGPTTSSLPVQVFSDYDTSKPITDIGHINTRGPPWNSVKWNTEKWGGSTDPITAWQVAQGYGTTFAIGMKFYTNDRITITGVGLLFEESLPL